MEAFQRHLMKSTALALFVLVAMKPCYGQEVPCHGHECAIETKSDVTGDIANDVVSLLQVTNAARQRSTQASTPPTKRKVSDTDESKNNKNSISVTDTDESSLIDVEHHLSFTKGSNKSDKDDSSKDSDKKLKKNEAEAAAAGAKAVLQQSDNSVLATLQQIVRWMLVLVAVGVIAHYFPERNPKQLYHDFWTTPTRGYTCLQSIQWFSQEWLNRLMLLLGAVMLLNAGLAFLKFFTPVNMKEWHLKQVVLFSFGAVVAIIGFAWGFAKLKDWVVNRMKEKLENSVVETEEEFQKKICAKTGEEATKMMAKLTKHSGKQRENNEKTVAQMKALLEQAEACIMNTNGFLLAHVWLDRYPIPANGPWWHPLAIFCAFILMFIIITLVKKMLGNCGAPCAEGGGGQRIIDIVNGVIFGTGTFVVVGFMVGDVREWASIPAGKQPPAWLGGVCLIASLILLFTVPTIPHLLGWTSKGDGEKKSPSLCAEIMTLFPVKSLEMFNNVTLFTTGMLIFQFLTMMDEYQSNVWWMSMTFILIGAAILTILPFTMENIGDVFSKKVTEQTTNMLTTLCGWLAGKMVAACFLVILVDLPRWVWLAVAIGWLVLAAVFEALRQRVYAGLKSKTEPSQKEQLVALESSAGDGGGGE